MAVDGSSLSPIASLTYLTFDEVARGVGASQVLPYVERVAKRGTDVSLHSWEQQPSTPELRERLAGAGVTWHPHRYRDTGSIGGLARVLRGAFMVPAGPLVHARSELAAASVLLARSPKWVWDVRSFWADERIAMGRLAPGSPQARVLRTIESAAARRSTAIITLTHAAVDVLARRHGEAIRDKATVIPTCVDTNRFALFPMPPTDSLNLMLSGSFNPLYDQDATLAFVTAVRKQRQTDLTLIRPNPSRWDDPVTQAGGVVQSASFAEMPARLRASHAGISLRVGGSDALSACAPIKLAEFLATGRPVVVNPGLGDMDRLLVQYQCGVVLADRSATGLAVAAEELGALIDDKATPGRCRAMAMDHFNLDDGVNKLVDVYRGAEERKSAH